ncbi:MULTISPECIES: hypothetical protein [unclassified Bradyrhizobium]|uniref:hypothetical protein n=1 Tax=unclassified Bradyrhizobium TaxID=2631580 RepID=UPI0028E4E336|nr:MULTISPECIES: hypothetical protein [unclassified Bradyrhizobium]
MPWSSAFDDPIPLPNGKHAKTLREAADYILSLPEAEQQHRAWQPAIEILIGAAEGRDFMLHAWIAMKQALGKDMPAPESPKKRAKSYRIIR